MRNMKEIEKKYLIDFAKIPFDLSKLESCKIRQQYLSRVDDGVVTRIRVVKHGKGLLTFKDAFITMKGRQEGLVRNEYEMMIDAEDAENIMSWSNAPILEKVRYKIPYGHLTIELDLFSGRLNHLTMAEVEFKSQAEAESFIKPSWFGDDVSTNFSYTNVALATKA